MIDPDECVLVCVINRKRDFARLRDERWYRIPAGQFPEGIEAAYLAFFFSRAFGALNGAVHCYARVTGIELSYRSWVLPDEPDHPRAQAVYYRVALGPVTRKHPPVSNPAKHRISFIRTRWDSFQAARTVDDLYLRLR